MEEIVEQAGAVTYRLVDNSFQILLVRSKKEPSKWIFPKGHIEMGESAIKASERELFEEAGVVGSSLSKIGVLNYSLNNRYYNVTYFITRFLVKEHDGEPGREPTWFDIEQALDRLSFPDMKNLLKSAVSILQNNPS